MVPALPIPSDAEPPSLTVLEGDLAAFPPPRAETDECACPEFCERDHDRD